MEIFTLVHVIISMVAILSGFVVLLGMISSKRLDSWTMLFLTTTVLTSLTGFFFPFHGVTPAIVVGLISMIVLGVSIFARYGQKLAGVWRKTYVLSALFALYLNVFVLVVQGFRRIAALKELAPTQNEPPFKIAQLVVLIAFIAFGIVAASRFRAEAPAPGLKARAD
jgi:hypothetical protein